MLTFSRFCVCALLCGLVVDAPLRLSAESGNPSGEYKIASLYGDQVSPAVALRGNEGFVVWQDNATDEGGSGIGAQKITVDRSQNFPRFRVNTIGVGFQDKPQVASLKNGGTIFVWQSGPIGKEKIFAKILNATGVSVLKADLQVNSHQTSSKKGPAVAVLKDGNIVVSWDSLGQDDPNSASAVRRRLAGVYAQIISPLGKKVGTEFRLNQLVAFNQRNSALIPLSDGNFAAFWVTEKLVGTGRDERVQAVSIAGRIFTPKGKPLAGEVVVSSGSEVCANPAATELSNGKLLVCWSQLSPVSDNKWDVYGRTIEPSLAPVSEAFLVNTYRKSNQYAPKVASSGDVALVIWTSLGQDLSMEGVFGQFLSLEGKLQSEFQINETTVSKQIHPALAVSEQGFLVVWSGAGRGVNGFDLFAKKVLKP